MRRGLPCFSYGAIWIRLTSDRSASSGATGFFLSLFLEGLAKLVMFHQNAHGIVLRIKEASSSIRVLEVFTMRTRLLRSTNHDGGRHMSRGL
jgi:hypothetical protein